VQTRDGTFLGHVFDLRCRWDKSAAGASIVEEIIYGRIGLAERLGFQVSKPDSVPWSRVTEISDRVIVVTLE